MIALTCWKRSRQGGQLLVAPKVAPVIPFIIVPDMRKGSEGFVCATARLSREFAGVAQPVEHLICNQRVGGSNPFLCTRIYRESPSSSPDRLRRTRSADVDDDCRPQVTGGHAGDSRFVRVQKLGAAQRCHAPGQE